MKIPPRNLILGLAVLLLVFTTSDIAFAKGSGGKKAASSPAPHHTTIAMINANSITVKEPTGTRTLTITQFTQITFKGQLARFDALVEPGMRVAIGAGTDPTVAERIDADDPPADGKK